MLNFLKSTPVRVATIVLLLQTVALYSSDRPENVPPTPPLAQFPRSVGPWNLQQEGVVDEETQSVLKADDLLLRTYVENAGSRGASLFVAAFRSTRTGKAPHSPKNCLPGSGYTQVSAGIEQIPIASRTPILVNRYLVAHGSNQDLVMYWYQSRDRVVADEFRAKFWLMADALRYNRTDTALVRVVVPVVDHDVNSVVQTARDFIQSTFGTLGHYLPA